MDNKELKKQNKNEAISTRNLRQITPLVDIYENENEILLHAEMPGVDKDKISVNIDNGSLTLSGIRSMAVNDTAADWQEFGDIEFMRAFSVPQTIDVNKINAEFKNGVLALHLPKSEAAKPRNIEITEN